MFKKKSAILLLLISFCFADIPHFSFIIFSDNTGDGPEKPEFSRMSDWIKDNCVKFVIGMGDHVKKGTPNKFVDFLSSNEWWRQNFFPTIADGDNEYFGENQADWGAGKPLFDLTDIRSRKSVKLAENGAEYYAQINIDSINVHFISLHYPDQPSEDSVSFKKSSKEYMISILNSIDKKSNDVIIIGAHSRLGYWLDRLNTEQKKIVQAKADLVLSATTHVFHIFSEQGSDGPLVLNTGSITRPRLWSSPGFVSVEVYDNPLRIEVCYIDCSKEKPSRPLMFSRALKYIGGRITLN